MIGKNPFLWALAIAVSLTTTSAVAQNEFVPPTLELNFSNPGARSMGFGGAFAALADDATAAFANPAGLAQLVDPEVSIEGRAWGYSTPYVTGGRIFGRPTGIGLDTSDHVRMGRSTEETGGVSFLSVVYPKRKWSFAFYRHQLADYEVSGQMVGLFSGPWPGVTDVRREFDHRQHADLEITSHAVAGAYQVTEKLSLGMGLVHFDAQLAAVTDLYGLRCGGMGGIPCPPEIVDGFLVASRITPELLYESLSLAIDDTDMGMTLGVLWRFSDRWRLGGFYRKGPGFELEAEKLAGPTHDELPPGTRQFVNQVLALADVYGLGLSYQTSDQRLTLSLEWDRMEYGDLTPYIPDENELVLENGNELHLGAEYVFRERAPAAAVRLGVWRDPDHRFSYQGASYKGRALLPPWHEEFHYAAGLGVKLKKLQIDLGVDFSNLVDTVSLSTIYSF